MLSLVVYVGFGSSLLNIPFATGTLTAYNCPAATRYIWPFDLQCIMVGNYQLLYAVQL